MLVTSSILVRPSTNRGEIKQQVKANKQPYDSEVAGPTNIAAAFLLTAASAFLSPRCRPLGTILPCTLEDDGDGTAMKKKLALASAKVVFRRSEAAPRPVPFWPCHREIRSQITTTHKRRREMRDPPLLGSKHAREKSLLSSDVRVTFRIRRKSDLLGRKSSRRWSVLGRRSGIARTR